MDTGKRTAEEAGLDGGPDRPAKSFRIEGDSLLALVYAVSTNLVDVSVSSMARRPRSNW